MNRLWQKAMNYNKILFVNNLKEPNKKNGPSELVINPPKSCPICGTRELVGEINLYSKNTKSKYIKIGMCNDHYYLKYLNSPKTFLYILGIISMLLFFIILIYIFTSISIIFLGGFIVILFLFLVFIKFNRDAAIVNNSIIFEFFSDYSILFIKSLDWAQEFKRLNQYVNKSRNFELYQILDRRRKRNLKIISILLTISICGFVISLISQNPVGTLFGYLLFITLPVLFISEAYFITKIEKLQKNNKLN